MRIVSSNIQLTAQRAYTSSHQVTERLRVWEGDQRPDFEALEQGDVKAAARSQPRDLIELSEQARSAAAEAAQATNETAPAQRPDELSPDDQAKLLIITRLLEQLTGQKINIQVLRPSDLGNDKEAAAELQRLAGAGRGVEYDRMEDYRESERTSFASTGVVRTADGKEIAVAVDLTMSREFAAHNEAHLRLGNAVRKDPLVINLSGNAAQLTTGKFSFDLDQDGKPEQISFVQSGSGFLALDKNGDGRINNGGELFGAATGDGFAELAAYDADGNQWIDEGDAIFNGLRVWTKDADGNDRLLALGQAGVGAIYLGNVATQFSVNDTSNQQHGLVQSTGIWLGEKGGAGTLQQLDLVV